MRKTLTYILKKLTIPCPAADISSSFPRSCRLVERPKGCRRRRCRRSGRLGFGNRYRRQLRSADF